MFHFLSPYILPFLVPFATLFSKRNWKNAQTLLLGAILCKGKRTVCSILRALGLEQEPGFSKYHRILSYVDWSPLKGASILLNILVKYAKGRFVFFIDETLERRKGKKIKAKGFYRDAVRSSKSNVVNASGLKWLVMAISVRFPFAKRAFALPFFTVLQPSAKCCTKLKKRHKTSLQWVCQMIMQVVRWLPQVPFTIVGDGAFACGELGWLCLRYNLRLVSRLKMNARLFDFPEVCVGKKGRPAKKGTRLVSFKDMLTMSDLDWKEATVISYGGKAKQVRYVSHTCLWGATGFEPLPIRWVLVTDPEGKLDPLPLMSTDFMMSAEEMIALYIDRWNIEVTFEEVREHLGVETQRQWSDKAIARTTPVLMGLYSLVCLMASEMNKAKAIEPENTAWYEKEVATFADLLKAVRKCLWRDSSFCQKALMTTSSENEYPDKAIWLELLVESLSRAA